MVSQKKNFYLKLIRFLLKSAIILFILLNIIAAFHAYKFTHFYNQGQAVIKKPEQQGVWDKTKSILFGLDFTKSKITGRPAAPYETVKLKTQSGLNLEGWHIKSDSAKGTVLMFHGHGSSKSKILHEADYFLSLGYNTFLLDFRAHGNSDGNTCTIGMNETEDVKLAYDYIQQTGEKNMVFWGISMGAATITRAVHEYKLQPLKIILEMPFGSLEQAVEGRVRMMGLPEEPTSTLLTFWGGAERGFWAFNYVPCNYAKDISCPVLLQWGRHDRRVTQKEIDCIYSNISSDKRLAVYEYASHQSLCDKEPEKWRKEVKSFLAGE